MLLTHCPCGTMSGPWKMRALCPEPWQLRLCMHMTLFLTVSLAVPVYSRAATMQAVQFRGLLDHSICQVCACFGLGNGKPCSGGSIGGLANQPPSAWALFTAELKAFVELWLPGEWWAWYDDHATCMWLAISMSKIGL